MASKGAPGISPNPDGKKAKSDRKGKGRHSEPPGDPIPPLVITKEVLAHTNWWPVAFLVMENSPVEGVLVDCMANGIRGNSIITLKHDDLIREAQTLLKAYRTIPGADDQLSRRDREKLAKKALADELARKMEAEDREAARVAAENQPMMVGKASASVIKQSKPALRNSTDRSSKNDATAVPEIPVEILPPRPRTLADDLFEELQYINKNQLLEEVLRNPSVPSMVLLLKYRMMLVKSFDMNLFNIVHPNHIPPEPPAIPVIGSASSVASKRGKSKKGGKVDPNMGKSPAIAPKDTKNKPGPGKASVMPKDAKSMAGSITKGKLGKGKGQLDETANASEPPPLMDDEVVREPVYIEEFTQDHKNDRARARERSVIASPIARILKKRNKADERRNDGAIDAAVADDEVPLGDNTSIPNIGDGEINFGRPDFSDREDHMVPEMTRIQQIFLASIMGTEGLPALDHSLSTRLALYGLPTFPASKYQMVRYFILQGFKDPTTIPELARLKANLTGVVKIQFMRHRSLPSLNLSDLLWVRHSMESTTILSRFWSEVDNYLSSSPKTPIPLCALTQHVKYDVTESSSLEDFQRVAKIAGTTLANLMYYVVRAKILFQFYNTSLDLQPIPRNKIPINPSMDHPPIHNLSNFLDSLVERAGILHRGKVSKAPGSNPELLGPVLEFVRNLEHELYSRGIIESIREDKWGFRVELDSRHNLKQRPGFRGQAEGVITQVTAGYHEDRKNSPISDYVKSVETVLQKGLQVPGIAHQYNRQWIFKLLQEISLYMRSISVQSIEAEPNINPLAEAMIAWNIAPNIPRKQNTKTASELEFVVPNYPDESELVPSDPPVLNRNIINLVKMTSYYAAVTYSAQQLLAALSDANEHFFHRCVRKDQVSGKTFLIFYAVHEKISHLHLRHTETRLHSRSDFPTFVCNIMDEIQPWSRKNIKQAYHCPRRPLIDPRFPYGCQNQYAYHRDLYNRLNSAENDHLSFFIKKHSLKNLVRLNKDSFAKRCNWKLKKVPSLASSVVPSPVLLSPSPLSPDITAKRSKASGKGKKNQGGLSKEIIPQQIPSCPPKTRSAEEEPFIWNRAREPSRPPCSSLAVPRIPAYSLANALTKANREEQRIYCRDTVVSVDRHVSFDGRTALFVTATITDGLEIFLTNDDKERALSLVYQGSTRVCIHSTEKGIAVNLYDPIGNKLALEPHSTAFCEVSSAKQAAKTEDHPSFIYFSNGKISKVYRDGSADVVLPDGRLVSTERFDHTSPDAGNQSSRGNTATFRTGVPHSNTSVSIDEEGRTSVVVNRPDGFLRRVEVANGLRFTTTASNSADFQKRLVVIEQPNFPRVGVEMDGFGYVALCNGVLVITANHLQYLIVMGANAMIVSEDRCIFVTKLVELCEAFNAKGLSGLKNYPTENFIGAAKAILVRAAADLEWRTKKTWSQFSAADDIAATFFDLGGIKHEVSRNGDVTLRRNEGQDMCVLPNPRIFVLDQSNDGGKEYIFGEEAVALKYQVMNYYHPKPIKYEARNLKTRRPYGFVCSVSEEPIGKWQYQEPDLLPEVMRSSLTDSAGCRTKDPSSLGGRLFRGPRPSSEEEKDFRRKIEFIPQKRKKAVARKNQREFSRPIYCIPPCPPGYLPRYSVSTSEMGVAASSIVQGE